MLKRLTLTLFIIGIGIFTSHAADVEIDGIKYDTNAYTHTASVVGYIKAVDVTIPETIILNDEEFSVTSIWYDAFRECKTLIKISLPKTITSIGTHAFYDCSSLQSVGDLPALTSISPYVFYGCTSLQSVGDLPALTSIGNDAFSRCASLQSVGDLPVLTSIGNQAFDGCTSLQSVGDLPALTSIGSYAFFRCSSLQSVGDLPALTSIGDLAFDGCTSLQSVGDLPALTSIGVQAFYECTSLQSVGDMPVLTSIGNQAFSLCTSLQSLGDIPSLTTIESMAFYYCGFVEFNLPESIAVIATDAFSGATTLVHFAGITPPQFVGTANVNFIICVPEVGVNAYAEALPEADRLKIVTHENSSFDVNVSARENDSDILNKVNAGFDRDMASNVLNLKVSGTINSYDIIAIRNKMLNLRKLDLSDATIVDSAYEYYSGCSTKDNIIGVNMFRDTNIMKIILPDNVTKIREYAFYGCSNLYEINIPDNVTTIGDDAFGHCSKLKKITFPEGLTSLGSVYSTASTFACCFALEEIILPPSLISIPRYCFSYCRSLRKVSLPPTLKSIGERAFYDCYALTEFRIPAGINSIGDGAIPGTVKDVYTYTIQPTSIGQQTFDSDTYLKATLHVPETSEALYYWDTQWSQFQTIKNFNEPYAYFYLKDKDLIEDPDTPRIDGETDEETGDKKNPDADLGQGSGLIVDGDNSQDLGNVDLEADGKGNGATIIGGDSNTTESGGNVNIDMLNVNIPIVANKWYFFAFPFDVPCENIKFNGQMVWRYYDGEWRAMHGSGSWKDMKGEKLERGRGYIFQGSKNGTLTLSIPKVSFDAKNWIQELAQYVSQNAQDASWNFIGNPFQSFYELADLGFDGPITWWNPNSNSYEAFSPIDDDLSMYPFMAFFVQKPEGTDGVEFFSEYRETNNQKNDPNHRSAARQRRVSRRANAAASEPRLLINLTVTDGTNSDRTRVVFNNQASDAYEVGVDASKFVSGDAPQIYSIDANNVRYAINERPAADGIVKLGFYAPASGVFTIGCTRNDCPVTLKDCQTGRIVTLNAGATYEFTAEKGYDDTRFVLNAKGNGETSIEEAAEAESDNATYYRVNGIETDGSHKGLMIEVKGSEASKVIRK